MDPSDVNARSRPPPGPGGRGARRRVGLGWRDRLEASLHSLWYASAPSPRQRLAAALLAPIGALTALVAARRRRAIARLPAPPVPVVVVGNLVAGGAGKTPLVVALVEALGRHGWRPGVVASGYGARRGDARIVPADGDALEHGDEAVLLARRTGRPVAAGRARAEALRTLLDAHPEIDVVVSDDGLQHAHLARSVEIAVFDERGAGNGRCLPAGPLRAPLTQATSVDAIALNGEARAPLRHPRTFGFRIEAECFAALHGGRAPVPADEFARGIGAHDVLAVAATGAPQRFFATLRALGIDARTLAFADHAVIDSRTLAGLEAACIVMTEKDAVKCAAWADARCWSLRVRAIPEPGFVEWLIETLHGRTPARNPRMPAVQGAAQETAGRTLR